MLYPRHPRASHPGKLVRQRLAEAFVNTLLNLFKTNSLLAIFAGFASPYLAGTQDRKDSLDVDCNVYASRQVELLELINSLGCGLADVDQTLVRADLERIHGLLVYVR